MGLILLEALAAGLVFILIVWWTMFSGRKRGELFDPARLPAPRAGAIVRASVAVPAGPKAAPTSVVRMLPTSEMLPVSWPEFGGLHPFAPIEQAAGYVELFELLEGALCEITGFAACSLQPSSASSKASSACISSKA